MKKRLVFIMCLSVVLVCLSACGSKETNKNDNKDNGNAQNTSGSNAETTNAPEEENIQGSKESWGVYSEIFVPEGMKIITGTITDTNDENAVWVKKTENTLNYFYFIVSTEEQSQKDIAATKESNAKYNPEDVTLKAGDVEWKGVAYSYLGTDVAQMYAAIGDKVINVRLAGFAYDSAQSKAILGGLKVK